MGKQHEEEKPDTGGSGYKPQPEIQQPDEGADTGFIEGPEINKPQTTEVPDTPPEYDGDKITTG